MKIILVAVVALSGFACASSKEATRATGGTLESAYREVASGAKEVARSGEYVLSRAGGETVRVMREVPPEVGDAVTDESITNNVKTRLGFVKEGNIGVETDAGVVRLQGVAMNEAEAMKAITTALATDGVIAVDSRLQWPTRAGSKTYSNEPTRE